MTSAMTRDQHLRGQGGGDRDEIASSADVDDAGAILSVAPGAVGAASMAGPSEGATGRPPVVEAAVAESLGCVHTQP